MDSLRNTAEASSYLRKEQSLVSSFSGMIFGGAQKNRISVIKSMTFLERQVELCHAESYLLKALLSILTDSNFTTFLKEGMAIRQSYATYKACYKFLAKLYTEGGADALIENRIDAVFITGVYLGIGGFNLILSLLPERLLKIIEFIGFSGQLEFGMQCLAIGGAWPVNQLLIQRSKKIPPKKTMKQKSALNFYCDKIPQETGCGTRKFMCEIMLHIYHVFIAGLIPVPACNVPVAKAMADRGLSEYPTSFLFLMARGKIYQIQRELKEAVDQFEKVVHVQKDWRQLAHVCFWEMGISLAADGKYQEAADYFGILLKENEWSKGIYAYIRAVLLYEVDPVKNKVEVAELLQSVPNHMKKIAGKSIPLEVFFIKCSYF
jgi:tetratricopeptide (TPR) repeat protein